MEKEIGKQLGGFDSRQMLPADDPTERLCDQVAAEFLVPTDDFGRFWTDEPKIQEDTSHFKASPIVAARRDVYRLTGLKGDTCQNFVQKIL